MPLAYVSDTPSKKQASVFLLSLLRIFDFALDTPPQQNRKQVCFWFRLIRISAELFAGSRRILRRMRFSPACVHPDRSVADGGACRRLAPFVAIDRLVRNGRAPFAAEVVGGRGATVASEGPVQSRLLRSGLWRRMLRGPPARDRSVVAGGAAAAARTAYGDASCVALRGGVRAFGVAGRTTAPADACRRCAVNLFGWHPAVVGRWVVSPGVSALRVRSESFGSTARGRVRSLPHADS